MLYLVFHLLGRGALVCIFAMIIAAAFLLAYRRSRSNTYVAGIVTICGALASVPTWGVRPQIFSLLLSSLFLLLLDYSETQTNLLCWLPLLMLLWVNLHGGFAIGMALVAAYLSGSVWDVIWGPTPDHKTRMSALGFALLACALVIPINPNGVALYTYPFKTLRIRALQHISEWRSPDLHHVAFLIFFWMVVATIVLLAFSKRKIRAHELLLLVGTALAGIHTIRHIPIFVLVAIPLLSRRAEDLLANRSWARSLFFRASSPSFTLLALNTVLLLFVLGFSTLHVYRTVHHLHDSEAQDFPSAAVSFLAGRHVPVPLFNHYDWGGYLIWRLYPSYRVWVDGRTDLYGDTFLEDFLRVYWTQEGWNQQLDKSGIQSVIVPPTSPLARSLISSSRWHAIYQDRQAVILTRKMAPLR